MVSWQVQLPVYTFVSGLRISDGVRRHSVLAPQMLQQFKDTIEVQQPNNIIKYLRGFEGSLRILSNTSMSESGNQRQCLQHKD